MRGVKELIESRRRRIDLSDNIRLPISDEGVAGSEPNTVSLRREIAVLDENDNPPVYHGRPYAARVPESAHVGGLLLPSGTITITDRDGGVNADVHVQCVAASRDDDVCEVFDVATEKVTDLLQA